MNTGVCGLGGIRAGVGVGVEDVDAAEDEDSGAEEDELSTVGEVAVSTMGGGDVGEVVGVVDVEDDVDEDATSGAIGAGEFLLVAGMGACC